MYKVSERYSANIAKTITFAGVYGTITMNDGTCIEINDEVISEGQLSILYKMNSGGKFGAGGVYPAEMSLTLRDFEGNAKNLEGAEIVLFFRLYTDGTFAEYDELPLGVFDADGSTIKRRAQKVSFKALDRLVQFDRSCEEMTGTLYDIICYACDVCGVPIEMTKAEFEELPNSDLTVTLNTARMQTWRDFLGYVGAVTSSFAKATRTGGLRFCPIACNKTDGGVIIPEREINGDIRFSTEFSDDTTRVTRLIMRRSGKELRSATKWTDSGDNRTFITLELPENPLFAGLSDKDVSTALNAALSPVANCLNRSFKASFPGDPALDIGDYVRLRGGDIDTSRGYGTGMITSMTWKYHGASTIECDMPSSVASSGASAASSETDSDGRVQPKSQLEKRVDYLETLITGGSGAAGTLTEYTVLSDTEIKYNGVTYTFSAGESGEITGVTTDKCGAFTPTIPGTLADISAHNAAFMAVALLSKLSGEPEPSGDIPDAVIRINTDDYTIDGKSILLNNQAGIKQGSYAVGGGILTADGGVIVPCTFGNIGIGSFEIPYTDTPTRCTLYAVMQGSAQTIRALHVLLPGYSNVPLAFVADGSSAYCWFGLYNETTSVKSTTPNTTKCVMAAVVYDGVAHYYINGTLIGSTTCNITYSSPVTLRTGQYASSVFDHVPTTIYDIAFAASAHDAATVADTSAMLMNKYNIGG